MPLLVALLIPTWGCLLVGLRFLLRRGAGAVTQVTGDAVRVVAVSPPTLAYRRGEGREALAERVALWVAALYPLAVAAAMPLCLLVARLRLGHWPQPYLDTVAPPAALTAIGFGLLSCGFLQILVLAVGGGVLLKHPACRSAAWALVVYAASTLACLLVERQLDFAAWFFD